MDNYRIIVTSPGRGEVWKNGEKLQGVTGVQFSAAVNDVNRVTLSFVAGSVEIEGPMQGVTTICDPGQALIPAAPVEVR